MDDLFGAAPPAKAPAPRKAQAKAPAQAEARRPSVFDKPAVSPMQEPDPDRKCAKKATRFGYVCRIGGGDACYSDNNGLSWFCRKHRPKGFFEGDR